MSNTTFTVRPGTNHERSFQNEQCLADLKAGRQSNIPIYSFTEHQRLDETKYLYGASIIIGTVCLYVYELSY